MADMSDGRVFGRTLVVLAAIALAMVIWQLTDLILLLFAGALVGLIFYDFSQVIEHRLRLPFPLALTLAVILPIFLIAAVFTAFGSVIGSQFALLYDRIPGAFAYAQQWLQGNAFGQQILARSEGFMPDGSRVVSFVQSLLGGVGTALTGLGVVIVAGVYLAAQPRLYGRGVLSLFPPASRHKTVETTRAIGQALNSWLKGQAIGMAFVGVFTGVALQLIGLPGALAIGLVAGLCEFVPYLGTFVVAIPAIILGFSQSPETGIWTLVALAVIQQLQGNIVSPLVQSKMAELPPALTIFSLFAAGILLGPMGVILAVPMTVVGLTLLKELIIHPSNDRPAADATQNRS